MKNLTPTQKRNLLADLITLKSVCGYNISMFMGKSLNYFDYEKVQNSINELLIEYYESNGCEFALTYSDQENIIL